MEKVELQEVVFLLFLIDSSILRQELFLLSLMFILPWFQMLGGLRGDEVCSSFHSSVLRRPAELFSPERSVIHALLWKQNLDPVKHVCVCEHSLGPDSAPDWPAIGGAVQTVAAGMLTRCVDFCGM